MGRTGHVEVGTAVKFKLAACFDVGITPWQSCRQPTSIAGKEIMNIGTKRTVIAAAALAAAGLFGSLPFDGSSVAQQGVPTQHHDVALVDAYTTLLGDEGTFDTALVQRRTWDRAEQKSSCTAPLATATSPTEATTLLDATGATPLFSGMFDGAESRFFEGLFLDALPAKTRSINCSASTRPSRRRQFLPNSLPLVDVADTHRRRASQSLTSHAAVGISGFDTDLMSIANADYSMGATDFDGLPGLAQPPTRAALGDLSTGPHRLHGEQLQRSEQQPQH